MMIPVWVFEHLPGGELYERIVDCTDKVRNEFQKRWNFLNFSSTQDLTERDVAGFVGQILQGM